MKLTNREREILPLLGLQSKDIANRLCIGTNTVKKHIQNLSYKFPDQPNKLCIVLKALKEGIITLDEIVTE